jgi:YVTN family beta-propeller protein
MRAALVALPLAALLAGACAEPRQLDPQSLTVAPPAAPGFTEPVANCARLHEPGIHESPSPMRPSEVGRGSSVQLFEAGARRLAVVADADERALHTVDVETLDTVAVTPLANEPTELVALDDGRIAVSFRQANRVAILEPAAQLEDGFVARCDRAVPSEPIGLASRGNRLLVTSGHAQTLSVLDTEELKVTRTVQLDRGPRAVVITSDGNTAWVSHAVGGKVTAVDLRPEPRDEATVDLRVGMVGSRFDGDQRLRDANQGFALALGTPFGSHERLFAPQVGIDTGASDEPVSSGYGSAEAGPRALAPFVASIDPRRKRRLTHELASSRTTTTPCTLPRAAVARDHRLWLACAGIDAVLELDSRMADPTVVEHRRFRVGAGPNGIAADAGRLVVWSRYDHELSRIDLDDGTVTRRRLARRDDSTVDPIFARGRVLFHRTTDPRISEGERACSSCHPDGLDDGLVWTSPDGRRQTKVLAGRLVDSAPYGWFGHHEDLASHLKSTIRRLGGAGFSGPNDEADLQALVHFIRHMPAPKPVLPEDERVARGRALFESAEQGCNNCHPNGSTNGSAYDVGSAGKHARETMFDTPSLRFVGQSAPYYHDGRYRTLRELLIASDGLMGHAGSLGNDDLNALEHYLRTL